MAAVVRTHPNLDHDRQPRAGVRALQHDHNATAGTLHAGHGPDWLLYAAGAIAVGSMLAAYFLQIRPRRRARRRQGPK